jgi:(E)-4-hydroxy-3-methylbut-2-enyl-diphosphate synthase
MGSEMKPFVPIHLYGSFNKPHESLHSEPNAWWLEIRTKKDLENLKRLKKQKGAKHKPSVIPVLKDPSLIEVCLEDDFEGIAVPLSYKDSLLTLTHHPAKISTAIYLIEEEFMQKRNDDEIQASLNLIKSSIIEIKKAGFRNLAIDLFHPDPVIYVKSNQCLKKELDLNHVISLVPLADRMESIVRNTLTISALFYEQIGSVLLIKPGEKQNEEAAFELGRNILATIELCGRTYRLVSCPVCGRCQWDLEPMSRRIKNELDEIVAGLGTRRKKLEECGGIVVAVMGCNVNGPGEASDADIGVAGGKNRTGTIFRMGKPYKTVREGEIFPEMAKGIKEVIEKKIEQYNDIKKL